MSGLFTTIREVFRYHGREGQVAWMGHRAAALGTVLFFVLHIIDTSFVYFWPEGYQHVIALYRSPLFALGEMVLIPAVIYHGINGTRIALMDWKPALWRYQRAITLATFALTIALCVPALIVMGGHFLQDLGLIGG